MDYNPLIPNITGTHDVSHILSEAFEETIRGYIFPSNVAENIRNNNVDKEHLLLKEYGKCVEKHEADTAAIQEYLHDVETNVMQKQGIYLIKEQFLEDHPCEKDRMKLKADGILCNHSIDVKRAGIIDKRNILPNRIEQAIDFILNVDLHQCPSDHEHRKDTPRPRKPCPLKKLPRIEWLDCSMKMPNFKSEEVEEPLLVSPNVLRFEDFDINVAYTKRIRLQNVSNKIKPFFYKFPRKSEFFTLRILSNLTQLAPGMYVEFLVTFKTGVFHNARKDIVFSTYGGKKTTLELSSYRRPPHLRVYIFRSLRHILTVKCPGHLEFWDRRCTALNDTIDCGHCFMGASLFLSLIVENIGNKADFFFLAEEEWISGEIQNLQDNMEFHTECFKIFPAYIRIEAHEIAEICVQFTPKLPGLHVEKLFLLSTNNTFKPMEILGDGLYFTKSLVRVTCPSSSFCECVENEDDENFVNVQQEDSLYLGTIDSCTAKCFKITVNNASAVYLDFYWILGNRDNDEGVLLPLDPSWIQLKNISKSYMAPYTTYDFDIELAPATCQGGYYNIFLSLFIEKIPVESLQEDEEFFVQNCFRDNFIKYVDVRICQIEICCIVTVSMPPEDVSLDLSCVCPKDPEPEKRPGEVEFSTFILDFGLIPVGIGLMKKFFIKNYTKKDIQWRILEIVYDVDRKPAMYIKTPCNLNFCKGVIKSKRKLQYTICPEEKKRWLSMLLLFKITDDCEKNMILNSVCTVTYEVIDWDIRVYTKTCKFPLICPLAIQYIGLKTTLPIFIRNHTLLTGCFWFLPAIGADAHKVDLTFMPKYGTLLPGQKQVIEVEITANYVGIIEEVYIPCFIGRHTKPIIVQLLCAVDDVSVYFYLPGHADGYNKILWPPTEIGYVQFPESEFSYEHIDEADIPFNNTNNLPKEEPSLCMEESSKHNSMMGFASDDYSQMSTCSFILSLEEFLKEKFGSNFSKQDYALEIRDVELKQLKKLTIYIENLTPLTAKYGIQAINFEPNIALQNDFILALGAIYPSESFEKWNEACSNNGIIVVPDIDNGELKGKENLKVNIWIYANTWGIYMEEIAIDIADLPTFHFTIYIEVLGIPLQFPLALNTLRKYPTLRFGHVPYMSDIVTQMVTVKNTSSIPVSVTWFVFDASSKRNMDYRPFNFILNVLDRNFMKNEEDIRLFLSNRSYGQPNLKFITISQHEMQLGPDSSSTLELSIDPSYFPVNFEDTGVNCILIGYIFISSDHQCQPNCYYRVSAEKLRPVHMEVYATIALPLLKLVYMYGNSKVHTYANQVIAGELSQETVVLIFKNNNMTAVNVTFHVEKPFKIVKIDVLGYKYKRGKNIAIVQPGQIIEITLICRFENTKIIQMANWIFTEDNEKKDIQELIDVENKIVHFHRHLNIHQRGVLEQSIPIYCDVLYPRIATYPEYLIFDHVLLGMTKRLHFSLYNSTNVDVEFEIKKTCPNDQLIVCPQNGIIPKAIGVTKQFVDIFVYFTPRICKYFQESLQICTTIPQCLVNLPLNGTGTQNEKFYVDKLCFQP